MIHEIEPKKARHPIRIVRALSAPIKVALH